MDFFYNKNGNEKRRMNKQRPQSKVSNYKRNRIEPTHALSCLPPSKYEKKELMGLLLGDLES